MRGERPFRRGQAESSRRPNAPLYRTVEVYSDGLNRFTWIRADLAGPLC